MNIRVTKCKWCNEPIFNPDIDKQPRSDKQFCSASHRAKYHRWLTGIKKQYRVASAAIRELSRYLAHVEAREVAATHMIELEKTIKAELSWHRVQRVK